MILRIRKTNRINILTFYLQFVKSNKFKRWGIKIGRTIKLRFHHEGVINKQNLMLNVIMSLPIDSAIKIASENMSEIFTVQEWTSKMDYCCPKHFSRKFLNHYGVRPKKRLINLKIEKFIKLIHEDSEISCYEIALELGLKDEIALSKFIKRHTSKPPSEWKKK